MSDASTWDALGLQPTHDRGQIRRAYACLLKTTNPEDDAEGFQRLRQAYENALAFAASAASPAGLVDPASTLSSSRDARSDEKSTPTPAESLKAPRADDRPEHEHEDARGRLERLLGASEVPAPDALASALDAVLSSRAVARVDVQADTERWLAELIADNAPRSDPLLEPAFRHFDWGAGARRLGFEAVQRVVDRRDDLRVLREMERPSHPSHAAFLALTSRPRRPPLFKGLFQPRLASQVAALLHMIGSRRPSLFVNLDSSAVAWWEDYLARPRLSPWLVWAAIFAPWIGTAVVAVNGAIPPRGGWATLVVTLQGASVGLAALYLYGVAWPRHFWMSRWAATAPRWLRLGWAPTAMVLLIAASVLPPRSTISAILVASVATVWWAAVTSDLSVPPLRSSGPELPMMLPIALTGMTFGFLGIWWIVVAHFMPPAIYWQMTFPLVAGMVVSTLGLQPLTAIWGGDLDGRGRAVALAGLGVMAAVSGYLIWEVGRNPLLSPLALASVAVTVLVQRIPALAQGQFWSQIRLQTMLWTGMLGAAAVWSFGMTAWPILGGVWLLLGVGVTLVGAIVIERRD